MKLIASVTCALAIAGMAPSAAGQKGQEDVVSTNLTEVRANPDAYRNVKIAFDVQFAGVGSIANPFFTKFVPSDFANFHAWGVEQPIWREEEFFGLFANLFLDKGNDQLRALYTLQNFDRMRLTAVVRNTFQGQPWIEVLSFEKQPQRTDWATLSHMYRAEQWMAKRQWKQAIAELSLASRGDNPPETKVAIEKAFGLTYLRLGEARQAIEHLSAAKALLGAGCDEETEHLLRVANEDPAVELDRQVMAGSLREADRPLWEAFEDAGAAPMNPHRVSNPKPSPAPAR
jgi:hypothetical protein